MTELIISVFGVIIIVLLVIGCTCLQPSKEVRASAIAATQLDFAGESLRYGGSGTGRDEIFRSELLASSEIYYTAGDGDCDAGGGGDCDAGGGDMSAVCVC